MALRLGIDATCWANGRGYGRFTRELVGALVALAPQHEFVCFLDARAAERFDLTAGNVRRVVVDQRVSPTVAAATGGGRSPLDMLRLTGAVRAEGLDGFFSPSVYGYFPLPPGLPALVTIHDAIPERFPSLTLPTLRDRLFWWSKMKLALAQARLVLTVSEYAAQDIERYLGVPRSRLRVSLESVAEEFRPSESADDIRAAAMRAEIPSGARWLMYVGGFGGHKNVDAIVRAHAGVAHRHPDQQILLLLVGAIADGFHQDLESIRSAIRESGSEALVRWMGYMPDEELRHLHSGAIALLLVSASEGFGLPAVEAARCGTPVIATTESPLPQILEGGGLFVEPGRVDLIEEALEELVTNEARRLALGRQARARAESLSWTASAEVVLKALEEIARTHGQQRRVPS